MVDKPPRHPSQFGIRLVPLRFSLSERSHVHHPPTSVDSRSFPPHASSPATVSPLPSSRQSRPATMMKTLMNSMTTISTMTSTTTSRRISTTNLTTISTMTRTTRRPWTTKKTTTRDLRRAKWRTTNSHAGTRSTNRRGGRGDPQPLDGQAPNWHHPGYGAGQPGGAYSCRGDDRLRLDSAFSAFHRHRPHGPVGVRSSGRSRRRGHGGPFSCL